MWGTKYPLVVRSWQQNWDELATFFKFPAEVRRLIYTTNIIEGFVVSQLNPVLPHFW